MSANRDLIEAVSSFREALDSKTANLAESKEKLERIEKKLDHYEKINEDITLKLMSEEKKNSELKDTLSVLERQISRIPSNSSLFEEKSLAIKSFETLLHKGDKVLNDIEKKYLRTDSDPEGGYLAPPEYIAQLIKKITEISPIRSIARIFQTSRESIIMPVRTQILTANWYGEGGTITPENSLYGSDQVKVNKLSAIVNVTIEELNDAAFNVETAITQDFAEAFAKAEGLGFVSGNGVNMPFGFVNNPALQQVNSGVAGGITADSFVTIQGELKVGYNPVWVMNRRTLASVRRLKDGIGQYLWIPGLAAGMPSQIDGYKYISAIDMPDIGTNTFPVAFGDFMRGYGIVDSISLNVIRDPYFLANVGQIRFIANRRVGGQVILAEAIKLMKCSA